MSYVIPQTRRQAVEIYNNRFNYLDENGNKLMTKYDLFLGALCGCSDIEFTKHTKNADDKEIICELCKYDSGKRWCGHSSSCKSITEELFSKRWNE